VSGFVVYVQFSDGTAGPVDLTDELYGEIFEPLKELSFFSQVMVHPEFRTLSWPNGADFAPEFLYSRVQAATSRGAPLGA
jgi:hypothetical protein